MGIYLHIDLQIIILAFRKRSFNPYETEYFSRKLSLLPLIQAVLFNTTQLRNSVHELMIEVI